MNKQSIAVILCVSLLLFGAATCVTATPSGIVALDVPPEENLGVAIPYTDPVIETETQSGATLHLRQWNPVYQVYEEAWLSEGVLYDDQALTTPSSMKLMAGDGIFLSHDATTTQRVYMAGDVLLDDTAAIELLAGLNLVGSPYAAPTDTNNLPAGISFVWPTEPHEGKLPLASAFWQNNASGAEATWDVERPYANVFSKAGLLNMQAALPGKTGFELAIPATSPVTILSKEVSSEDAFVAAPGWQIMAENVAPVNGSATYTDPRSLEPQNALISDARFFLATDTTIDTDSDGVPDGIEIFVFGSSPTLADSDGDGISDGEEFGYAAPIDANQVTPQTYYVDIISGNDQNTGLTPEAARATINSTIAMAATGSRIYVAAGVYPEGRVVVPAGICMISQGRVEITD